MKKTILIALAAIACTQAFAETGNELLAQLKSPDTSENLRAYSYIFGVFDAENTMLIKEVMALANLKSSQKGSLTPQNKLLVKHFCAPDGVTGGQIFDLVKAKLESRPDLRHHAANLFVTEALVEAWPCKNNP